MNLHFGTTLVVQSFHPYMPQAQHPHLPLTALIKVNPTCFQPILTPSVILATASAPASSYQSPKFNLTREGYKQLIFCALKAIESLLSGQQDVKHLMVR